MKKSKVFVLVVLIFVLAGNLSYASGGSHWADGRVEKKFENRYFSHLKTGGTIDYNSKLKGRDYLKSIERFCMDFNIKRNSTVGVENLTRRDLINILGPLADGEIGGKLPFKDIDNLNNRELYNLHKLYNLKILNGISENEFGIDKELTYAEGIIALQNIKNIISDGEEINFKIKSRERLADGNEYIKVKNTGKIIEITIVYRLGDEAKTISIDKILKGKDVGSYNIVAKLEKLEGKTESGSVERVVINVPITELDGKKPYDFKLLGVEFPSGN